MLTVYKDLEMTDKKLNLDDLEALSGPAPVLRTEDRELYDQIRARFMACFTPGDVLEWQLVNRLVDEVWFIKRYTRHQTSAIERWYQQGLGFQAQRLKAQNARKEALANRIAERMTQSPPEVADLLSLEDTVTALPAEFDEILQRTPTELQHNRALEKSIVFQEQLDKLIASATKRFNDTLELLEHYREGLGARLRQAAEELLETKSKELDSSPLLEAEAPSILPPGGRADEMKEVDQTPASAEENK
jgi:hypothetical protein